MDLSGEHDNWWGAVTHAVEGCGVRWTHLWPGDFMENALVWVEQIRQYRQVRDVCARAVSTPIAMRDIARVAAHALTSDDLVGSALSLTGPQALTREGMVALIGEAIGERIPYVELSRAEALEELGQQFGEFTETYLDMLAELGHDTDEVSSLVEDLTGRATTFREWAFARASDFR